jgi:hypothetical protein
MSAIGELLREIMPAWLSPREPSTRAGRFVRAFGQPAAGDARRLAREADEIWQQCVDEGRHGEAFPDPLPRSGTRAAKTRSDASSERDEPAGSNGPH